jgi:GTPase SAR1 family protein
MEADQILDFITMALSAEPDKNKLVEEYRVLLNGEYSEFVRDEDAHDDDAAMLKKMQEAGDKFEEIARFKSIKGKRLGAVAGQFSSGKSAFINSLMLNRSVRLKTDMLPTTAIPTYVCCGEGKKPSITGYSCIGSRSARFDIPVETFESIDHAFINKLRFNLKNIIPYITVSCPMNEKYFSKICLIDTPGYDPAKIGFSLDDYSTAVQHIATSDFLIWVAKIQNCSLADSGLKILENLQKNERLQDLYIIANQADDKTEDDINRILDNFEDELFGADIKYAGLCAYSSDGLSRGKVFQTRGKDLYKFFEDHNFPSRAYTELEKSINDVFDDYKNKLERQKDEYKNHLKILRDIDRDWTGMDLNKDTSDIKQMQTYFSTGKIDKNLEKCEELRFKFLGIIERLDSVDKYVHIIKMGELLNYLSPFKEKAGTVNSDNSRRLSHVLNALERCLNMIFFSKFLISDFEKMLEEAEYGGLYMAKMSSWVLNSIEAVKKYQKGNQIDAEKLLGDICKEIADTVQNFVNDHFGEKATLDGDNFYADVKENIFVKNKINLKSLKTLPFYDTYKAHGGKEEDLYET